MTRLAVALVMLVGCGDDGGTVTPVDALPPDASPDEVIMASQPLEPLDSSELILTAGPGDLAVITLSAPANMGWNIHGHAGGGTQIVDEERGVTMLDKYVFSPGAQADWYLLIRNESGSNMEIDVRVELFGDIPWRWQE